MSATLDKPVTAADIFAAHCPPGYVFAANLEPGAGVPTDADEALRWACDVLRIGGKSCNGNRATRGGRRPRPDELQAVRGHVVNVMTWLHGKARTGPTELREGGFMIYKRAAP